ncbi:papain-like cysteine protease family protein [Pseudobacteroides cellulosolvens]|uniref:Peptidase C39-like domain-containing protein n=1 Tax=Pseudobacteroides cellulosolvens ATCC 35603 = DSM 2933 TaxID=398512 RepID=A0A0L6JPA3_9FIRM|nr:papain-like cysteine protease family protein [Pseudobacteroides cellulosolvens]KNY27613.1 hypothetical protein Bccel_2884 [Pseudobacteroides cellulosolvens ATCC 35603 = DSM 2933]
MSSSTDIDYFRFSAPTTGNYRIETKGFNNTTGQIYSGTGQLLLSDTDTADNCVLEMKLQKNVTYYIKINDRNGASGNYTISVTKGKTLSVVKQTQQPYDLLCWATSASMVSAYFNNSTLNRTLEIAKYNNPTLYSNQFNQPNYMYNLAESIERYITGYTRKHVLPSKFSGVFGTYPIDDIVKAIDMNSPIAFLIANHCVVGKGYIFHKDGETGPFIIYNDPWDGQEHTANLNDFLFTESICYIPTPAENGELEVNDSVFSADNVKIGIEKVASINNEGDVDYYQFTAYPGNYTVETFGMTDTYGEVYKGSMPNQSPDGRPQECLYYEYKLIGQDNSSGAYGNFKINFTNTDSQRHYYIKVKHSSPYITGNYSIKVTRNSDQ